MSSKAGERRLLFIRIENTLSVPPSFSDVERKRYDHYDEAILINTTTQLKLGVVSLLLRLRALLTSPHDENLGLAWFSLVWPTPSGYLSVLH
ncbi:hypothetical protein ElyMa_000982900 [Elysia marginata]|uniref:Uncharacterized protein n=1 Tax=Elysia marginata TaxID=1093978 RepID=A0AAV4HGI4_9GAST|nr:hypothetical protein ElyMa_000982900 [Elysia marginata]